MTRAFLAVGPKYMAIWAGGAIPERKKQLDEAEVDRQLAEPVRELLRRGAADKTIRTDLPTEVLFQLYTALLERALVMVMRRELGAEQATAAVLGVFLRGATA